MGRNPLCSNIYKRCILLVFDCFKPFGNRVGVPPQVDFSGYTIFWMIRLLILPILDFVGLISRQVGELLKLGLWSFKVTKASRFAITSTLCPKDLTCLKSSSLLYRVDQKFVHFFNCVAFNLLCSNI